MNEKQIEIAARTYALNMGEDPDEDVFSQDTMLYSQRWKFYIEEVKSYLAIQEAIKYARGE